eukprot:GHVP01025511.1.p1 GENE.GHVP01025511.1~~GHVP01025511.1.p1  ORF type:complete len:146 (+),score=33.94 GHVP01025511.1:140-577(+)
MSDKQTGEEEMPELYDFENNNLTEVVSSFDPDSLIEDQASISLSNILKRTKAIPEDTAYYKEESSLTKTSNDEPLYVNYKQFNRIIKRREERKWFDRRREYADRGKPYAHKSRHDHAMKRPRGPGGRFLTKAELAEMDIKKEQNE